MSDSNVHVDTHPSGHPNKTAVNPENPIFGRPADPVVTEVSVEQAAIVQSDKAGRETVVSPLINEEQLTPAEIEDAAGKEGDEPEAAQDSEPETVEEPVVEEAPVESDPVVTEVEPASAEA